MDDGYMDSYIQDELELDLLTLGGQQLLHSAHDEADDYVDREYPWDGVGDEPAERASAWLAVLWQRAEEARGVIASRNQRQRDGEPSSGKADRLHTPAYRICLGRRIEVVVETPGRALLARVLDAVPECATGGVAFRLVVTATRVKALPAAEQAS